MAGRLLGLIPDVETFKPMLGTALGVGGYWNLPLTCYWLAVTRAQIGRRQAADRHQRRANRARRRPHDARRRERGRRSRPPVMLRGYGVLSDALAEFEAILRDKNVTAADSIGRAADRRKTFADMPPLRDNWRRYIPSGP